jgi:hypothetical protein
MAEVFMAEVFMAEVFMAQAHGLKLMAEAS